MFPARPGPLAVIITLALTTASSAQLTDQQRKQLVQDMRASVDQLDADRIPNLQSAQQDFMQRVAEVHQHLNQSTTAENRDAWLAYFQFEKLLGAIRAGDSPATLTREARDLQERLIGTYPGLEVRQVRAVRDSVNVLIPAIRYREPDQAVALIGRQLTALAKRFEQLDAVPSIDDAAAANLILGILHDANQDVLAVATLKELYSRPNMRVWFAERFVQQLVEEPIDEYQPVRDCILGTSIYGTAHFVGESKVELLPADGAVRMKLTVVGQAVSNNVGYRRPVRLRSKGYAGLCVTQTLSASDSGVTFDPTYVDVNLKTELTAIEHRSRLVRRIAWRKAGQSKGRADRIATERMRQKLRDQFDRDVQQRAAGAGDPMSRVRPVLQRLEFPEPERELRSTDDAIYFRSVLRRGDQVGSAVSPPEFPTEHNAVVQIHESAIDNALSHLLAGRTVREEQIEKLLADAGRQMPEKEKDEDPFVIDFASVRPIVFEARDDKLRFGVRATRFSQGARELKQSLIIAAQYAPASTPEGKVILIRDGKVQVSFPGRKRLSLGQAGLRRVIVESFDDIFPATLLDRPLKIPADFRLEALRDREFTPRMIAAADGWLTASVE